MFGFICGSGKFKALVYPNERGDNNERKLTMEINMLRKALWVFLKPLITLITNLLNPEIGEEVLVELKKFNRKEPCWVGAVKNAILRLLSGGEVITIAPCDGTQTLAQVKDVFKSSIDSNFKKWGLVQAGNATVETAAQVHKLEQKADFAKILGSLGSNLKDLCFTQHQIIAFCRNHSSWLSTSGATLFLFKIEEQFFVALVSVDSAGLLVDVRRFGYDYVWNTQYQHRLVSPLN